MKYQCQNCQFCCIASSQNVNYCGLASECVSSPLTSPLATGISLLCLALFAIALLALYRSFRNRQILGIDEHPQPNIQSEQIQKPSQPVVSKQERVTSSDKKQVRQSSRGRSSKSIQSSKFSKFTTPSPVKTDTERRLA